MLVREIGCSDDGDADIAGSTSERMAAKDFCLRLKRMEKIKMKELTLEKSFDILMGEYGNRRSNNFKCLIRNTKLGLPETHIVDSNYVSKRKLKCSFIKWLGTCEAYYRT